MYDIIVVGAGPAGMTAAIYARRAGKRVLVLEALSYGGQIINTPISKTTPPPPTSPALTSPRSSTTRPRSSARNSPSSG